MTTYTLCQLENEYVIIGFLLDKNTRIQLSEAILRRHWIQENINLDDQIQMYRSSRLVGEEFKTYIVEKSKIVFLHHFDMEP